MDPRYVREIETIVRMRRVQALHPPPPSRTTRELLGHDLATGGPYHYTITASNGRDRGHDHDIPVPEYGLHRFPADFKGIGVVICNFGQAYLVPSTTHRIAAIIEETLSTSLRKPYQR